MADEAKSARSEGTASSPWTAGPITLMVVGAGQRGTIYASYASEYPERVKIVAVAEPRKYARARVVDRYDIPAANQFTSWEEAAKMPKLADGVIITTQDSLHRAPAVAFARLGYHILLEKPMAVTVEDCCEIVAAVKKAGVMLAVGHVLRYMPYSRLIRRLVTSGAVGVVGNCQHLEPIGFWHFAHSYVRGNWRKESESTFMLMAKCCHDVDIIRFFMNEPFSKVSSFGSLRNFRKELKPKGAGSATRCLDCPLQNTCPYSATRVYLDGVKDGATSWPVSVLVDAEPDVENITEALRIGPYGRCAWECDNDVVDNQTVNFQFGDGRTATLTTVAFTRDVCKRHTRIFGTLGEIEGDGNSKVKHTDFRTGEVTVHTADSPPAGTQLQGHNGADFFLMDSFVRAVAFNDPSYILSGPDETLESHLAVFAAEQSRHDSTVVDVPDYIAKCMARAHEVLAREEHSAASVAVPATRAAAGAAAAAAAGAAAAATSTGASTASTAASGSDDDGDVEMHT